MSGPSHIPGYKTALKAVETELSRLVSGFTSVAGPAFTSASVYQEHPDPVNDNLVVMATSFSGAATKAHRDFVTGYVMQRSIARYGTSVGEASILNRDMIFSRSGYRSDQHCLNLKLNPGKEGDNILQFVFESPDFAPPVSDADARRLASHLQAEINRSGLRSVLAAFKQAAGYREHLFDSCPGSDLRQAILLFYDISGSTGIRQEIGNNRWVELMENVRAMATDSVAATGSGELIRSEGDGAYLGFACTGFDNGQKQKLFQDHALPAALGIVQNYNRMAGQYHDPSVKNSHIRIAMTLSDVKVSQIDSRYHKCELHGDGYLMDHALIDQAPRGHNVILVESNLSSFLPLSVQQKAKPFSYTHYKPGAAVMFNPN